MNNALISTLLSLALATLTPSDSYAGRKDCPQLKTGTINVYESWHIEKKSGGEVRFFVIKGLDGKSRYVRIETK